MSVTNEKSKMSDAEMAEMLGISRPLWQRYRKNPEDLPDYKLLSGMLELLGWTDIFKYLNGRLSKKALVKKIIQLQEGNHHAKA